MCQSLCNPVYLLACRNSVPGTYCRKFGWALWLMLEMHVAAQMDKINFANESSSFGFYTWKVTLKGTSKLCVCLWPFPSFFFSWAPSKLSNILKMVEKHCLQVQCYILTECFEFQVLRLTLFGMWAVAFAPSVALGRGSWEAAVAAWGLWADTWISSWMLCGSKNHWTQRTVTGDLCSPRWQPNLCSMNCVLPCTSDLQFCFCLVITPYSSFCFLCKYLQKETCSGCRWKTMHGHQHWVPPLLIKMFLHCASPAISRSCSLLGLSKTHTAFGLGFKLCSVKCIMKPSCHISKSMAVDI